MPERYKPDEAAHSIIIGKTTFVVNSFTDTQTTVTAEELIIKMLKSKVAEAAKEEKTACSLTIILSSFPWILATGISKTHCTHSPRESQHTRPNRHLRAGYFISEKCITALVRVTRTTFPTKPLTKNFVC